MIRLALLGVLAGSLVTASTAFADPAADAKKVDTAKRYVDAGIAAQQAGDYDTAFALYSKAYGLVPKPILVFNMAQATRLAGREAQAIDLYKEYIEEDPNGPQVATARDFVNAYVAKQAATAQAKQTADQAAVDQAAAVKAAEEKGRREQEQADLARRQAERQRRAQMAPPPPQPLAQEPSEHASPSLRIAGIATGVVGIAGIGTGIGFGLHARSLSNDLSQPGAVYDPDKVSSGQTANHIAIASYVVGGVLAATGVTLLVLGSRHGHADAHAVSVVPAIFRGGGGLAVAGYLP